MNQASDTITIDTRTAAQTAMAGAVVGHACTAGDVVALQGELGAGKTQFVRGMAEGLGLNPRQVSSPTFVLVQEYEPPSDRSNKLLLVHIDAYRIKSDEDLASIGWHGQGEELREQAVVAVEWASLIKPALGEDVLWVRIEHEPDGRRISLWAQGTWRDKMHVLSESFRHAGLTTDPEAAEP